MYTHIYISIYTSVDICICIYTYYMHVYIYIYLILNPCGFFEGFIAQLCLTTFTVRQPSETECPQTTFVNSSG